MLNIIYSYANRHLIFNFPFFCHYLKTSIDHLLDQALANPDLASYLNEELINKEYRGYGGVRLEDVVAITSNGLINFTLCPRTQVEIENVMSGGKWPPLEDNAPELRRTNLCKPIKYQINGF